jgi:transcription antitermination factor NusG
MACEIVTPREWFAMRVRTNHENAVSVALQVRGLQSFLPTYQRARAWSDRIKELHQPLFPGYVFCCLAATERTSALRTPGAMSFIGIGMTPIAIPETEIKSLRTLTRSFQVKPWPFLKIGQKVRIERGPLCGVEGIIEAFRSGYRIVVSVELLQRSVAAELEGHWLTPLMDPIALAPKTSQSSAVAAHNLGHRVITARSQTRRGDSPRFRIP